MSTMAMPTQESRITRLILISITVILLVILLLMPLAVVFAQALSRGIGAAMDSLGEPEAQAAIGLTLLVAAISVPLNTVCGVAAAWCVSRYRFNFLTPVFRPHLGGG